MFSPRHLLHNQYISASRATQTVKLYHKPRQKPQILAHQNTKWPLVIAICGHKLGAEISKCLVIGVYSRVYWMWLVLMEYVIVLRLIYKAI